MYMHLVLYKYIVYITLSENGKGNCIYPAFDCCMILPFVQNTKWSLFWQMEGTRNLVKKRSVLRFWFSILLWLPEMLQDKSNISIHLISDLESLHKKLITNGWRYKSKEGSVWYHYRWSSGLQCFGVEFTSISGFISKTGSIQVCKHLRFLQQVVSAMLCPVDAWITDFQAFFY